MAATGVLTKYNHRQSLISRIAAEIVGATAADIGPAAAQVATALDLRLAGNIGKTIDSDAGITSAPPIDCSTRAPISTSIDGAIDDRNDDTQKMAKPSRNILLRPRRSAMRPAIGRKAAVPIRYPDDTNATVVSGTVGNESEMSPNAIFVAVELNPTSTYPAAPIASPRHAARGTSSSSGA